jgi:ABC-type Mn2+/Zn2+ transport system permease subunit
MYVLIAVAVVVLLQGVGLILVYALLVIPPATGARVGTDAQSMVMVTLLVSLGAGLLGTLISYPTSLPVSAVSGLLLAGGYSISLIARRGS